MGDEHRISPPSAGPIGPVVYFELAGIVPSARAARVLIGIR